MKAALLTNFYKVSLTDSKNVDTEICYPCNYKLSQQKQITKNTSTKKSGDKYHVTQR